jgi:hypothetical protein
MTKTILGVIALTMAVPAVAQTAPAPAPEAKQDCCEKMKAEGKPCCCKDKMDHMKHGAEAPAPADHKDHAAH